MSSILRTSSWNIGTALPITALVIFCIALTVDFIGVEQLNDSLRYAADAESGNVHAHHILHSFIIYFLHKAFNSFCSTCDLVFAGQLHSMIWLTIGSIAIYIATFRLTRITSLAFGTAALLAVSNCMWLHSVQAGPYAPFVGTVATITAVLFSGSRDHIGLGKQAVIAGLLCLAIFYHQAGVLLVIPLAVYLTTDLGLKGLRIASRTIGAAGALTLAVYIWMYYIQSDKPSFVDFTAFTLGYGINLHGPDATTFARGFDGFFTLIQSQLEAFVVLPWTHRTAMVIAFGVALLGIAAAQAVQAARKQSMRAERVFLITWLASFFSFYFWYIPSEKEFMMATMIPVLLILALTIRGVAESFKHKRRFARTIVLLPMLVATGVFARNLEDSMIPLKNIERPSYLEAEWLASWTPKNCKILADYGTKEKNKRLVVPNLLYYFKIPATSLWDIFPDLYYNDGTNVERLTRQDCTVLPFFSVTPEVNVSGESAFSQPRKYVKLIETLFRVCYTTDGDISHRDYTVMKRGPVSKNGKDVAFIWLKEERTTTPGLEALLLDLESENEGLRLRIRDNESFSRWLEAQQASSKPLEVLSSGTLCNS